MLLRSTFALALLGAVLQAQVAPDHPFRAADDSASPRIATLRADFVNGNHTYLNWRGGFADGLVALLGAAPR